MLDLKHRLKQGRGGLWRSVLGWWIVVEEAT